MNDDYTDKWMDKRLKMIFNEKNINLSDEEKLEKIDIKVIEKFLRKKKLNNINK